MDSGDRYGHQKRKTNKKSATTSSVTMHTFPLTKMKNIVCSFCEKTFSVKEPFDIKGGQTPLVQFCGHPICEFCAKNHVGEACNICEYLPSPEHAAALLPINAYVVGIICASKSAPTTSIIENDNESDFYFTESLSAKLKKATVFEHCTECHKEAHGKCMDCIQSTSAEFTFCRSCFHKCHSFNFNQHHTLVPLNSDKADDKIKLQIHCPNHPGNLYRHYCKDCNIACCHSCMYDDHRAHLVVSLTEWNKDQLDTLDILYHTVGNNMKHLYNATLKISKELDVSDHGAINELPVVNAITQHFVHLHGVLQNLEGRMIESARMGSKNRDKKLEEMRDYTKNTTEKLQNGMLRAGMAYKNFDFVDLSLIIKELADLASIPCHIIEDRSANKNSQVQFHTEEIIEMLESHCKIEVQEMGSPYRLQTKDELPEGYELTKFDPSTPEFPELDEVSSPIENSSSHQFINGSSNRSIVSSTSTLASARNSINTSNNSFTSQSIMATKKQNVHVTHIDSPSKFYVRLEINDDDYLYIKQELRQYVFRGQSPMEIINNNIYAVWSNGRNFWYRGRVNEIDETSGYRVYALDYGFEEINIPKSCIFVLTENLKIIGSIAEEKHLANISPISHDDEWSTESIDFMIEMLQENDNNMSAEMFRSNNWDDSGVDLIVGLKSTKSSVRDALILQGYGTLISNDQLMRMNPYSSNAYHYENLVLEKYYNVEILHVDNPHNIYVRKSQYDEVAFKKMSNELTDDYSKNKKTRSIIYSPTEGMPCAVSIKQNWFRAIVVSVPQPQHVQVFLVDFGNTVTVKNSKMRRLDTRYQSITTRAIKISLRDVKPPNGNSTWSKSAGDCIKTWIHVKVRMVAYEKIGLSYSVCLVYKKENLNSKLVLIGEAISTGPASKPVAQDLHESKINKEKLSKTLNKIVNEKSCYDEISSVDTEYLTKKSGDKRGKSRPIDEDPFKVRVKIVNVVSPSEIYVADIAREQEFTKIEEKIQSKYSLHENKDKQIDWDIGKICIIYSEEYKQYCRGQIEEFIDEDKVIVFLIDKGKKINIELKNLQQIGFKLDKFPAFVFRVKLGGMIPCGGSSIWPSVSCARLRELIEDIRNSRFYITKVDESDDGGPMIVELFAEQINIHDALAPSIREILSINRKLLEHGYAVQMRDYDSTKLKCLALQVQKEMSVMDLRTCNDDSSNNKSSDIESDSTIENEINTESDEDDYNDILEDHYKNSCQSWAEAEKFKDDEFYGTSKFVSMDGCAYIVVAEPDNTTEKLKEIEKTLQSVYSNKRPESKLSDFQPGDIVIAKMHTYNTWHRAQVLRIKNKKHIQILFVDWGNVERCDPKSMYKMIMFKDVPLQATKCQIFGLKSRNKYGLFTKEEIAAIHKLIVERRLFIKVVDGDKALPLVFIRLVDDGMVNVVEYLFNNMRLNIHPPTDLPPETPTDESETEFEDSVSPVSDRDVVIEGTDEDDEESNDDGGDDDDDDDDGSDKTDSELIKLCENKYNDSSSDGTFPRKSPESPESNVDDDNDCEIIIDKLQDDKKVFEDLVFPDNVTIFRGALGDVNPVSPNLVTIHLLELSSDPGITKLLKIYKKIMREMQECIEQQPLLEDVNENTPCCAKFDTDGNWYRCLVKERPAKNDPLVKVEYVDFGNTQMVQINELRTLRNDWIELPKMRVDCRIWGVKLPDSRFDPSIKDWLKSMCDLLKTPLVIEVKKRGARELAVQIYKSDKKELLYQTLLDQGKYLEEPSDYDSN